MPSGERTPLFALGKTHLPAMYALEPTPPKLPSEAPKLTKRKERLPIYLSCQRKPPKLHCLQRKAIGATLLQLFYKSFKHVGATETFVLWSFLFQLKAFYCYFLPCCYFAHRLPSSSCSCSKQPSSQKFSILFEMHSTVSSVSHLPTKSCHLSTKSFSVSLVTCIL